MVLTGQNGSGKTNLLEAISLLVPGRGLRGARLGDIARRDGPTPVPWAIAGRFSTPEGPTVIGTGVTAGGPSERRTFQVDGQPARNQSDVADRIAAVWLTPAMDRLFAEGAQARRRFLDRLVLALDPSHARAVAAHEQANANRNRLLAAASDSGWLSAVEDAVARHAVAAAAARLDLIAKLNAILASGQLDPFPAARLAVIDPIAERLASDPAVAVEDWVRGALAQDRARDTAAGGARLGAHRADLAVRDSTTDRPAAELSTGEQKTLLISLILAHARLITTSRGFAPLLLLDEPIVHLDSDRRAALFAALAAARAQAFLTGTDPEPFDGLPGRAARWSVMSGMLRQTAR